MGRLLQPLFFPSKPSFISWLLLSLARRLYASPVILNIFKTTQWRLLASVYLYTSLPFYGTLVTDIVPPPFLPYRNAYSRHAAGAILNSDGGGSHTAINRRSIKE